MNIMTFRRGGAMAHCHEHPGVRIQATWRGAVLAGGDRTIIVEGDHYFPREDVSSEYLSDRSRHTTGPSKGEASCYDVVDGERNEAAGWYYPEPSEAPAEICDHVAFWKGVETDDA